MCKVFSATLKGTARSWFRKLSHRTIDSFGDLSRIFVQFHELQGQTEECLPFIVYQKDGNILKDYVKRFNQAVQEMEDSYKVVVMAMMESIHPGLLFDSLSNNVPETLLSL